MSITDRHNHLWLKRKPLYDKEAEGAILISSFLPQSQGQPGPGGLGGCEGGSGMEYGGWRAAPETQDPGL